MAMATARKAKKPIIHFGAKSQKKFVSVLCCFLLHIDLFTHSADMLAQMFFEKDFTRKGAQKIVDLGYI